MNNIQYKIFDKLVVRVNSTPLNELQTFLNTENQKQFLVDFFAQKTNKEKLYIASPSLYNSFESLMDGELDATKERKTIYSLAKYFLRMSNRPTPFGLFAGCFSAELLENQGQFLFDDKNLARHTRMDMGYFMPLIARLSKIKVVKENLTYTINSSLYRIADEYRYIEYAYVNKKRSHKLTSVGCSDYLNEIIKHSTAGISYQGLMSILKKYNPNEEELVLFIDDLIESQILVHSLDPPVTDIDNLMTLIEFIRDVIARNEHESVKNVELVELRHIYEKLSGLKILLAKLDSNINSTLDYENVTRLLSSFNLVDELHTTLQIDLIGSIQNTNAKSEYDVNYNNIGEALKVLIAFSSYTNATLEEFKRKFVDRYERQEMPLLEVLDEEVGIGYPVNNTNDNSALLIGIPTLERPGIQQVALNRRNYILFEKIQNALIKGLSEVDIIDDDVEKLIRDLSPDFIQPQSIGLIYRLFFDGKKNYPVILYCGGSSTTNLISRFCYGDDAMMSLGRELTAKEMATFDKDYAVAEIVHLPQDRIGNVLIRPSFYEYEIPFWGPQVKSVETKYDLMI